uniref:Transmembrane protein n=1 Tax=Fagus sylvatica TaxID=28930 RepID=A0A2N9FIP7_FAGSY
MVGSSAMDLWLQGWAMVVVAGVSGWVWLPCGLVCAAAQSAETMRVAVELVVGLRVWWSWAEVGGFGLLRKRDRWLLVEVMGLGCCGKGIGGCGFGVEEGSMAIGRWWVWVWVGLCCHEVWLGKRGKKV